MTHVYCLTKNFQEFEQLVKGHVEADQITQGIYWDNNNKRGCFIGCLNHSSLPDYAYSMYGIPRDLQKIAESIFEALPADEAKKFFAEFPDAVACNHKDLSKVHWRFLAGELRILKLLYNTEGIDPPRVAYPKLISCLLDFCDAKDKDIYSLEAVEGDIEEVIANGYDDEWFHDLTDEIAFDTINFLEFNGATETAFRLEQKERLFKLIREAPVLF